MTQNYQEPIKVVSNRLIGDLKIFDSKDEKDWETMYQNIMNPKYKKGTRNFSTVVTGKKSDKPNIYLIPRVRGGSSYKESKLVNADSADLQYCLISKGYPMQDLSSFSLGPITGEGLCLVNSAFSKCIMLSHLEGNGKLNLKRKNYWQRSKTPIRKFDIIDKNTMWVIENNTKTKVNIFEWLKANKNLWFNEWNNWRKHIALTNIGDFHWNDDKEGDNPTIAYGRIVDNNLECMDFVIWKKECYIKPFYQLAVQTNVYKFLNKLYKDGISLGLVHPKSPEGEEKPITKDYIRQLFDSSQEMTCVPFVIAGLLLGVEI